MKDFLCLPKDAIPLHCQRDVVQLSYLFTCLGIFSLHLWEVLSCCRNDRTSTHQRTDVFVMIKYRAHRKLKGFSKVRILVTASFGEENVAYVSTQTIHTKTDIAQNFWNWMSPCTKEVLTQIWISELLGNHDEMEISDIEEYTRMNNIYNLRFLTFS